MALILKLGTLDILAANSTTSSYANTASYSLTASYALNVVSGSSGTTLTTGSTYPITSSWSLTASYALSIDALLLDQTVPQTVSYGAPVFQGGFTSTAYEMTGSIFNYLETEHTLTVFDNGRIISINNDSAVNLNISNSLDPLFNCMVYQSGSGQVTFNVESGLNIRNRNGATKTAGQYAIATLLRVNSTDFILAGDVS